MNNIITGTVRQNKPFSVSIYIEEIDDTLKLDFIPLYNQKMEFIGVTNTGVLLKRMRESLGGHNNYLLNKGEEKEDILRTNLLQLIERKKDICFKLKMKRCYTGNPLDLFDMESHDGINVDIINISKDLTE